MARGRRRKVAVRKNSNDDSFSFGARRSSMQVNLSFVSTLSDSEHGSLKRSNIESDQNASKESTVQNNDVPHISKNKTPCSDNIETSASVSNITVINAGGSQPSTSNSLHEIQDNSLKIIKEKEQQLNKTCMQLKDAIINKTQALFDRENELAIKTSEVLAASAGSLRTKTDETNEKRSPSIRVNIKKNEQLVMSGDGRKKNPVQVNAMVRNNSPERQIQQSENYFDSNQRIISTPKKLRTGNFNNGKESFKNFDTIVRIPVVRLFAEDSDPNNSLSEVISPAVISPRRIEADNNEVNINNRSSKEPNQLNYTISPILSQGTKRRTRISCLSLKKKLTKRLTQSSKLSVNTTAESFINRNPLTSSSFVEKQEDVNNKNEESKSSKTIDLAEKSESSNKCNTINLEDNDKSTKTIIVENSTHQSCMEITSISAKMPIIRRSFQQTIRKSLQLDNIISIINPNENLNKDDNTVQNDCSNNTIQTSSINTSIDRMSLIDQIAQKENKKPNSMEATQNRAASNQLEEEDPIIPCQSTNTVRLSMQVNTSLDSVRKSLLSNNVDQEQEKNNKTAAQQLQSNTNVEKENISQKECKQSINSLNSDQDNNERLISRPSTSTVRTSMQVNTSLDSAKKSPITKNVLDFNQILSMVEETTNNNDVSEHTINHSSDSDNELENISLMERIRNISSIKKSSNVKEPNQEINRKRKSTSSNDACSPKKIIGENKITNKSGTRKSARLQNSSSNIQQKPTRISKERQSVRKSYEIPNISTTSAESSVIEATPYPTSRSVLMKTMIKNNIAMNTLDPKKFTDLLDDTSSNSELEENPPETKKTFSTNKYQSVNARKKTLSSNIEDDVLSSSDESGKESNRKIEHIIIDETLNVTTSSKKKNDNSSEEKEKNKAVITKRKLYPLQDNSQLISFSPADIQDSQKEEEPQDIQTRKKRKVVKRKKQQNKSVTKSQTSEPDGETNLLESEIQPQKNDKPKKKARKINSKKIVIKKVTNLTFLDNLLDHKVSLSQRLSQRNSLREFDLRRLKSQRKQSTKINHKIIIVATGLTKEEKDLVKSTIKKLGSATLEQNVTPRTTHVISPGTRTINLLRGILRGCWLLSLEWATKSLENGKWLDPSPYEMIHFAKAVQENRRDRQFFGKSYVPELFLTCGLIYIESGTSPPNSVLKELVKTAGGRITEDSSKAEIIIGSGGLKEIWILDSITTGEIQPADGYKQN